jgi:hypothetical protein
MITQVNPSPEFTSVVNPASAADRTVAQKSQAKAQKKERKHERLRFFFGWCEGCQFFGSSF